MHCSARMVLALYSTGSTTPPWRHGAEGTSAAVRLSSLAHLECVLAASAGVPRHQKQGVQSRRDATPGCASRRGTARTVVHPRSQSCRASAPRRGGEPRKEEPRRAPGRNCAGPPGGADGRRGLAKSHVQRSCYADPLLLVSRGLGLSLLQLLERTQIDRSIEANSSALPLKGSSTRLWGTDHLRPRAGGGGPA